MRREKVLALLIVALAGCDLTYLDVYRCENPDEDHKDANGEPDPCHRNDPTASDAGVDDAGGTCAGPCVPTIPADWSGPALVWMGAEADAPACSAVAGAPGHFYEGHADLDAPIVCGACTCDPPSGSCALPATLTASAATCAGDGPGVPHTPFNPPPKWDGTCTAANAIPGGKLCGGVPCVQSVTIGPLTKTEGGCLPIEPVNVQPPATWKTFARACVASSVAHYDCGTLAGACAPRPPSAEFRLCALRIGDPTKAKCPEGYPDRSVFYDSYLDARSCKPCTCGAPHGSTCTGSISIFNNDACSNAPLVISLGLDATGPKCSDVSPGSALLSKSATAPTFTSGACVAEGGTPDTQALPDPGTAEIICCLGTP
jgi:hypothetical protein